MRWVAVTVAAVVAAAAFVLIRRALAASRSRDRLRHFADAEPVDEAAWDGPGWARFRWLSFPAGLLAGGLLWWGGAAWPIAAAFGVLVLVLALQAEATWAEHRERVVERQLSEVLDMMVASVKAGAALTAALESARDAVGRPMGTYLDVLVGRIRLGDTPQDALADFADRVPLETVRLFSQALAVNWSVGGKLSETLANVGRTVRDRAELTRRTQAMSTQARLSVVVIIGVTYFIAALMWRNDPSRFAVFLRSTPGQVAVGFALAAQAAGTLWIARLSRPRF